MADRRRRRRVSSQGETEESEDETTPAPKPVTRRVRNSECESEQGGGAEDSEEFESADDGNEEDDDDETETDDEDTTTIDDSVDFDDSWIEERQSGDGQEQPDEGGEKALDDDEDQKNPAYIPRKGAFYEHDTRIDENEEDKRPKKKLWQDEGKWDHDRFRPDLQAPKSREEIIAQYGYDIRAYDKPPDAPKRSTNKPRRDRQPRLQDFIKDGDQPIYDNRQHYHPRDNGSRDFPTLDVENQDNWDAFRDNQESFNPQESGGYFRKEPRGRGRGSMRGAPRRGRGSRGAGIRSYSDFRDNRYQDRNREGFQDHRNSYNNEDQDFPHLNQTMTPGRQWGNNKFHQRDNNRYNNRYDNSYDRKYDNRYDNRSKSISPDKLPSYERAAPGSQKQDVIVEVSNEAPADLGADGDRQYRNTGGNNSAPERKSYSVSRERRGKTGKTRVGHGGEAFVKPLEHGLQQMKIKDETKEDLPPPVPPPQPSGPAAGRTTITTNASQIIIPTTALVTARPIQTVDTKPAGTNNPTTQATKPDSQSRPKRYSSQRQRNIPEVPYQEPPPESKPVTQTQSHMQKRTSGGQPSVGTGGHNQRGPPPNQGGPPRSSGGGPSPVTAGTPPFYPGAGPAIYAAPGPRPVFHPGAEQPVPPLSATSYPQTPLIQQPVAYTIPVTSQMQSPPRLFSPATAATIATLSNQQPPIMQTAYMPAPLVNYAAPPPPGPPTHYQISGHVPLQTYAPPQVPPPPVPTVPPPVAQVAQVAPVPQVPQVQPPQHEAIHVKGGTTYFNPVLQHPSPSRSPIRRIKTAIPIVNPQDLAHPYHGMHMQGQVEIEYEEIMEGDVEDMEQYESSFDPHLPAVAEFTGSEQTLSAEAKEFSLQPATTQSSVAVDSVPVVAEEASNQADENSKIEDLSSCLEAITQEPQETLRPVSDESSVCEVEKEQSSVVETETSPGGSEEHQEENV